MKLSRSKILWATVLTLAALFGAVPSALAQDDRTTASEVVDRDTLKAFVLSARDYIASITDINQLAALAVELREEGGDWKGDYILALIPGSGSATLSW